MGPWKDPFDRFAEAAPLPPDPVIEAYKKDVDRTLLRENLRLTIEERLIRLARHSEFAGEMGRAGHEAGLRR